MSRVYTTDEFEEAILANNPGCYLTLTQLGKLSGQDDPPREEEVLSDSDFMAELKAEALFQKLNPRPEVPGELRKPEPLSYDMEIQQLIRETHLIGISQGVSTVLSGGIKAPSPIPKPSKKKKKGKRRSMRIPAKDDDSVLITSSNESVEIVEDPKKICTLVINPAAVKRQETSSSKQSKDKIAENEVIEISSSEEEMKGKETQRKKFFSPKELYEMKRRHK